MSWKQAWIALAAFSGATVPVMLPISTAQAQVSEGIAAVVNEDVITTWDVRQRAALLLASSELEATRENQQRAQQQALRDLIEETIQLQEARHYEVEVTDEQINEEIDSIAQQAGTTRPILEQQLLGAGIRPETLREQIHAEIAWRRVMNGLYGSRIRIADAEVDATQARIAANAQRSQYLVSEIFLPAETPDEVAEARSNAQQLLTEMQRGAPFPLVARQFSAAPSAVTGGDLGWISAGELAPELQTVLDNLQPGQVSVPIMTPRGIYVLALRERREGAPPGSAQVFVMKVTAPASSRVAMERARSRVSGCAGLASAADDVTGAEIQDLGFQIENTLLPEVRSRVGSLQAGQPSDVYGDGAGVAMVVLCARDASSAGVPSRDDIENRLYEEELSMLSQRHLRNLRREASITSP